MHYRELAPDPTLRHLVRCFWFLTGDGTAGAPGEPALPDGSPELIISLGDPFRAFIAPGAPVVQPLMMLVGQITRPFVVGGISPKLLARITRFQHVFRAWQREPATLGRIAMECGYFDQPHLIRDFRDFAGTAPAAFLSAQPEFTAFFTSGS